MRTGINHLPRRVRKGPRVKMGPHKVGGKRVRFMRIMGGKNRRETLSLRGSRTPLTPLNRRVMLIKLGIEGLT
jgi:hypothetical protein